MLKEESGIKSRSDADGHLHSEHADKDRQARKNAATASTNDTLREQHCNA